MAAPTRNSGAGPRHSTYPYLLGASTLRIGAIADGAGNVDLYYNGALVATKTGFGALTNQAGGLLFVGNTTGITSPQTVGVNLLTIGSRRWSKEHMAWLYNGGAGRRYPF